MNQIQFKALSDACMDSCAKAIAEVRFERLRSAEQHRANMAEIDSRLSALEKAVKPRHRAKAKGSAST